MDFSEYIKIVESWMEVISVQLKTELHLNKEGICSFQVGEDTIISIEVSKDYPFVNIYSTLTSLPSEDYDLAVLMMARSLELNAFQAITRGGAIAAIPGERLLIFCYTTPIEGESAEIFNNILGRFYETVIDLKSILTNDLTKNSKETVSVFTRPEKTKPLIMIRG